MVFDARAHVFERLEREAAQVGAAEIVGVKTYGRAQGGRHGHGDGAVAAAGGDPRRGHVAQWRRRVRPAGDAGGG